MIGADLSNLGFDADVEMDECEGKFEDIGQALASTKYKDKCKLESRLVHLKFRLKRVVKFVVQDETNYKKFSELLNRTVHLLSVSFPLKQKKSKEKQDKPLSSGSASRKTEDEDEEKVPDKEMEKLVMLMKSKMEDSFVEKVLQGLKNSTFRTQRKEEESSSESSADSTETEEVSPQVLGLDWVHYTIFFLFLFLMLV
jgi:hypothetical protein